MSGIRNQEDAEMVTLHGACRVVSDVIITGGAAVLVPRLVPEIAARGVGADADSTK